MPEEPEHAATGTGETKPSDIAYEALTAERANTTSPAVTTTTAGTTGTSAAGGGATAVGPADEAPGLNRQAFRAAETSQAEESASGTSRHGSGTDGSSQTSQRAHEVKDQARQQAADVAGTAKEQASAVADTAKEQAGNVLGEAKTQAGDLFEELRRQLAEQSDGVRDRLAQFLTSAGSELGDMAGAGGGSGYATQVVRQVGDRASGWGAHLTNHDAGDLLEQTRSFARRKPGTFLLGAVVAGVVAGRLTRGAKAHHDESTPTSDATADSLSARPAVEQSVAYSEESQAIVARTRPTTPLVPDTDPSISPDPRP